MFDFIRNHQRLMQFLLLILIVPPFAFFGIDGYKKFTDDASAVANIGGYAITPQEFAQAQGEQLDRQRNMSRQLNIPFDAAAFDNPAARAATLDTLINQRVLTTQAIKRGVVVSDARLQEVIMQIPAVQENGQFSRERYLALLAAQGFTADVFQNRLRQDLSMQALNTGIGESSFAPRTVLALIERAQEETRDLREFAFKAEAYAAQVKVTPEAAKAYYDANTAEFQVPAQMRAEYVVMSVDALAEAIAPSGDEIKAFYDQNIARYRQDEQRQASHILIKFEEKSDRAALKTRAEELVKQARAPGADFAALAKKNSQDPGSAAEGGSLGSFGRGSMVKAFEDAVFAMKEGEISNPVESEFGYHIIKLTGIKAAKIKAVDEVRAEIERELKKSGAQKKFTESAEGFTNMVYEQADSLKPAAEKYKLQVQTTPAFARAAPPRELSNAKLLERLFSDDAIKARRNTEALEIAPGTLVSARMLEFKPQIIKPYEQARDEITARLTQKEALALARKDGEAKLKAAQTAPDAVAFATPKTVSRVKPEGLSVEALRTVMSAPAARLPVIVGMPTSTGYALYRIDKVSVDVKPDAVREKTIKSALNRVQAEADFAAYLESLRKTSNVVIHKDKLEKK